jgi:hypothetical protein
MEGSVRTAPSGLLALALAATLAAPAGRAGPAGLPARVERFVLEWPAGPRPPGQRVAGLVEWRLQDVRQGVQIEREIRFAGAAGEGAGRVLHVERLTESDARLVWREIGTSSGRSLLCEWLRDARGLRVLEWGRDGARRATLEPWNGVAMPLYLIELARVGRATQGSHAVFDPLSRRLERLELRTSYELVARAERAGHAADEPTAAREAAAAPDGAHPAQGAERTVELRRSDGTLAGRFVFLGVELVAFELQEGGPRARRVSAEDYARLCAELEGAGAGRAVAAR